MRHEMPDLRVAACVRIARDIVLSEEGESARRKVLSDLREHLAHLIVENKLIEEDGSFLRTYRLELYVASPDEFARMLHEEASKLTFYLSKGNGQFDDAMKYRELVRQYGQKKVEHMLTGKRED